MYHGQIENYLKCRTLWTLLFSMSLILFQLNLAKAEKVLDEIETKRVLSLLFPDENGVRIRLWESRTIHLNVLYVGELAKNNILSEVDNIENVINGINLEIVTPPTGPISASNSVLTVYIGGKKDLFENNVFHWMRTFGETSLIAEMGPSISLRFKKENYRHKEIFDHICTNFKSISVSDGKINYALLFVESGHNAKACLYRQIINSIGFENLSFDDEFFEILQKQDLKKEISIFYRGNFLSGSSYLEVKKFIESSNSAKDGAKND